MSVEVNVNQPMPAVAGEVAALVRDGHTVAVPVAPWRRPGLATAIAAALESGQAPPIGGSWSFTDPPSTVGEVDTCGALGWGDPAPAPTAAPLTTTPQVAAASTASMLAAAHTAIAVAQPVMTTQLKPAPTSAGRFGVPTGPAQAVSMDDLLSELADLDSL